MDLTHVANPVRVNARAIVEVATDNHCHGFMATLSDGSRFHITAAMSVRHTPVVGDYIVTQEDGYVYLNPKDVFERKYSAIPKPAVDVYSHPDCVFNYCPSPNICKRGGGCINAGAVKA